jgi:hypothetical protein
MALLLRLTALAALVLVCSSALARDRVRVRADAAFHGVGWAPAFNGAEVAGSLRDELGAPVGGADVALALGENREAFAGTGRACRDGEHIRTEGGFVVTKTDVLGVFCVRVALPPEGAGLEGRKLRFAGDRYYGPAEATLPPRSGQHRLELFFEERELIASLDDTSFVVNVGTRLVDGVGTGMTVRLVLAHRPALAEGESGEPGEVELGATDIQAGGRARFDVETRALGLPGVGRLVVRFDGNGTLTKAAETALLTRRAMVRLELAAKVPESTPDSGVELSLGVSSAVGAVTDGYVEAYYGGQPAGTTKVTAGAARLVATFAPQRGRPAFLTVRYVAEGAGFVPGEPLIVAVPLRGPSAWTWVPWLFVASGVAYWVVRAWRRPPRIVRPEEPAARPPASGHASIDLVEAGAANAGWRGVVLDAHDGDAISGARVSLVVPVFDGEGVAATHTTGEDGQFALPHVEAARQQNARLVVTAPFHTTLAGSAPRDGVITIALVSRRRTLLDRLVSWASRAGRPWSRRTEPTPFEVAEVARRKRQTEVAAWASAVGEAAFGFSPPDERREEELAAREPPLPGSGDER